MHKLQSLNDLCLDSLWRFAAIVYVRKRRGEKRKKNIKKREANLFLCGDVNVALAEVEKKVPVDDVSNGVSGHLTVHVCIGGEMNLN